MSLSDFLHIHWAISAYATITTALIGACIASFIMCMISRQDQPLKERLIERSHCDACGYELSAGDLIPVFGWLVLGGKCRRCGARIPVSCIISELCLGTYFAACLWLTESVSTMLCMFAIGSVVFAIAVKAVKGAGRHCSTHIPTDAA